MTLSRDMSGQVLCLLAFSLVAERYFKDMREERLASERSKLFLAVCLSLLYLPCVVSVPKNGQSHTGNILH